MRPQIYLLILKMRCLLLRESDGARRRTNQDVGEIHLGILLLLVDAGLKMASLHCVSFTSCSVVFTYWSLGQ